MSFDPFDVTEPFVDCDRSWEPLLLLCREELSFLTEGAWPAAAYSSSSEVLPTTMLVDTVEAGEVGPGRRWLGKPLFKAIFLLPANGRQDMVSLAKLRAVPLFTTVRYN